MIYKDDNDLPIKKPKWTACKAECKMMLLLLFGMGCRQSRWKELQWTRIKGLLFDCLNFEVMKMSNHRVFLLENESSFYFLIREIQNDALIQCNDQMAQIWSCSMGLKMDAQDLMFLGSGVDSRFPVLVEPVP